MIEYASCMNIYLKTYKITPNKIKRKTPAPSDPITTSKCESAVCGSKSTKSKLFYITKNEKSADAKMGSRNVVFPLLII